MSIVTIAGRCVLWRKKKRRNNLCTVKHVFMKLRDSRECNIETLKAVNLSIEDTIKCHA